MMRRNPDEALAVLASAVIVLLTGAAFWLSYEHLHDTAAAHGLADSRAWAWPGCLDAFVVAGELLMLRAAIRRRIDLWAIGLVVVGSGGSIALNVAGTGAHAGVLDYVVSAVPPSAALLAFGALMRQVHSYLAEHVPAEYAVPEAYPPADVDAPSTAAEDVVDAAPVEAVPALYPAPEQHVEPAAHPPVPVLVDAAPDAPSTPERTPLQGHHWRPVDQFLGTAVPATRTRPRAVREYVPAAVPDEDEESAEVAPDPVPDPTEGTTDEQLADLIRHAYAADIAVGKTPSIRAIRAEVRCGQDRAKRIQTLIGGSK
jgi:hypothetical protein